MRGALKRGGFYFNFVLPSCDLHVLSLGHTFTESIGPRLVYHTSLPLHLNQRWSRHQNIQLPCIVLGEKWSHVMRASCDRTTPTLANLDCRKGSILVSCPSSHTHALLDSCERSSGDQSPILVFPEL